MLIFEIRVWICNLCALRSILIKENGSLKQLGAAVQLVQDMLICFHLRLMQPGFIISTDHLARFLQAFVKKAPVTVMYVPANCGPTSVNCINVGENVRRALASVCREGPGLPKRARSNEPVDLVQLSDAT